MIYMVNITNGLLNIVKLGKKPKGKPREKQIPQLRRLGFDSIGRYELDTSNNGANYDYETAVRSPMIEPEMADDDEGWHVLESYGRNSHRALRGHEKWKLIVEKVAKEDRILLPKAQVEIEEKLDIKATEKPADGVVQEKQERKPITL